jgi:hypothetical protein
MSASAQPRRAPWSDEVAHCRAVVAGLHARPETDPALQAARSALTVAMAKDYYRRLVVAAPTLTSEQLSDIAALFQSGRVS